MKFQHSAAAAVILLISAPFAPAQKAEKLTLKPALEAGGHYQLEQVVKTTMEGGKQDHTATQDYTLSVFRYGTGEKKDKLVRSKVNRVRIETNATADGKRITFDSGDPKQQHPSLAEVGKGMLAVTSGAIYDEDDIFKSFEGAVSDDATKALMKKLTDLGFPAEPVGPGDTWKHQVETQMGQMGLVKYDLDYHFTKMARYDGHQCALLAISGSLATIPGAAANEGFDIRSRSLSGVMYFDPELGAVRKYEINSQLDLTAYGRKMPGSMNIRTVLKKFSQ